MRCGVGCRLSLDPMSLWLWCRLTAVALIQPLAWEPPYAAGAALKRKTKRKKKKNRNTPQKEFQNVISSSSFSRKVYFLPQTPWSRPTSLRDFFTHFSRGDIQNINSWHSSDTHLSEWSLLSTVHLTILVQNELMSALSVYLHLDLLPCIFPQTLTYHKLLQSHPGKHLLSPSSSPPIPPDSPSLNPKNLSDNIGTSLEESEQRDWRSKSISFREQSQVMNWV